jgi:hypothetical protein
MYNCGSILPTELIDMDPYITADIILMTTAHPAKRYDCNLNVELRI